MYAAVLSRSENPIVTPTEDPIAMEQSPKSGSISSIKKLAPQKIEQEKNTRSLTIPNHMVESNSTGYLRKTYPSVAPHCRRSRKQWHAPAKIDGHNSVFRHCSVILNNFFVLQKSNEESDSTMTNATTSHFVDVPVSPVDVLLTPSRRTLRH